MLILMIVSIIAWARNGTGQLRQNWFAGSAESAKSILKQIFDGFCISTLSLTGTECEGASTTFSFSPTLTPSKVSPDYAVVVRQGKYYKVARNVHLPGIVLYGPLMLLLLAIVPLDTVLDGANVLSVLAERVRSGYVIVCAGLSHAISGCWVVAENMGRSRRHGSA